jgi:SPP1 gp7 family putative phage head morphogenesis protein
MGYWEQRLALRDAVFLGIENNAMGVINAAYTNAAGQIEREIKKIIGNYAFWKDLKKSEALRELKSLAPAAKPYAARISRLEAIRASIKEGMEQAAGVQLNATKRALRKVGEQAYYRTIFDIQKRVGMFGVGKPDKSINQILRNNWSGENWSARVWQNQRAAAETIQQAVVETLTMGGKPTEETYRRLFDEAMKKPGTTAKQATHAANRIIRTESAYVANQESLEAYNEVGIEEYEFISVLDSKTSAICQGMDGKTFKTKDAEVGVNFCPMHPYCRSTTAPVLLSEAKPGTRYAKNLKTGRGEIIPSDMNYQDWVKWQADGSPPIEEWRK